MSENDGVAASSSADADFDAAAAALAAREGIVKAIGPLAASPLSEGAAERMRTAIDRSMSPQVRAALRTITAPSPRPSLVSVPVAPEGDDSGGSS